MTKAILQALFTLAFFIGVLMFLTQLKFESTDRTYIKSKPKFIESSPTKIKNSPQNEFENLDE